MSEPAFVVLAHRHPAQLARLADRLAPLRVYLHVDAAVPAAAYDAVAGAVADRPNVTLIARHRTGWASWGLVEAALEGAAAAVREPSCSHVMVLSGQDYPLTTADDLRDFFAADAVASFVAYWKLPHPIWGPSGGMDRLRWWQLPVRGRRVRLPIRRSLPDGVQPYGSPMYWALTAEAVREVLRVRAARPDLVRFYRHAWIPDEMFVATVVMNSPHREAVVRESLTYTRWPEAGGAHPAVLGADELDALAEAAAGPCDTGGWARRKLFARKFDGADPAVLDAIDARLLAVSG